MTMVWDAALKSTAKLVMLRLSTFGDDDGRNVFPGVKRVAADTGLTERAVRETFRDLESIGVLILVSKEDPVRHRPREYRICLDRLRELAVATSVAPPEPRSPVPGTTFPHPRNHVPPSPERGSPTPRNHVPPIRYKDSSRIKNQTLSLDLGGGEASPPPAAPDLETAFAEWWKEVPRKVAKGAAQRAYQSALKHATPAELRAGIRRYADEVRGREERFIAHPATWLNGQRWLDEPGRQGVDHAQSRTASRPVRNGFVALALEEAERRHQDAPNDPARWDGPTLDLDPAGDGGA